MSKDPVADAKAALDHANKAFPSSSSPAKNAPKAVSGMVDGLMEKAGLGKKDVADAITVIKSKKANIENYNKANPDDPIPSMHTGGVVKKDGLHNLQKGELVVAKDKVKEMKNAKGMMAGMAEAGEEKDEKKDKKKESKKEEKSEKKHAGKPKYKQTIIEHHSNHSHTVRHIPHMSEDGKMGEEMSYAAPDMAALHQGMDANVGQPEPAEASPEAPAAGPMPGAQA